MIVAWPHVCVRTHRSVHKKVTFAIYKLDLHKFRSKT